MSLKKKFNALPLFWKVCILIVSLIAGVVALSELVLSSITRMVLASFSGQFMPWHEALIWTISIIVPSITCGYILSRNLSGKLEDMAFLSTALARGNLEVRLPVIHNDKDAFDKLARSFNEMADAIERQLQNERQLLMDISHELRSPLTRITLATELLVGNEPSRHYSPALTQLEKEVFRMNELLEMVLSQSAGHSGKTISTEALDLRDMLVQLACDFSFQGTPHGKKVICRVEDALMFKGNAMLLLQMVGNILSNAIFYAPNNSEVFLIAMPYTDHIEITIRDLGPGVPEESLKDIFRAFYRVDSARAHSDGGAGLGLALAREAALAHDGDIRARNAHPGLEVIIILPLQVQNKS